MRLTFLFFRGLPTNLSPFCTDKDYEKYQIVNPYVREKISSAPKLQVDITGIEKKLRLE